MDVTIDRVDIFCLKTCILFQWFQPFFPKKIKILINIWSYNAFLLETIYYGLKKNRDGHIFHDRTVYQAVFQNYGPRKVHLIIRPLWGIMKKESLAEKRTFRLLK